MIGTLAGRNIVITRPAGQADELCDAIVQRGGNPLRFPLLAIGAPVDGAPLAAVTQRLEQFDVAFFVSPNAVRYALQVILASRPWPPGVVVATVGKGSEKALGAFGFSGVVAPSSGFDSESVLALPTFHEANILGKNVLILRGDGGRDLLGETLRKRGARVEYVTCYRRYRPAVDPGPLLDMAGRGRIDAVTLTSSEAVRNLSDIVGSSGMALLRRVPAFAPHPRIAGFARDAGFEQVIETGPGDAGLLDSLESHIAARLG